MNFPSIEGRELNLDELFDAWMSDERDLTYEEYCENYREWYTQSKKQKTLADTFTSLFRPGLRESMMGMQNGLAIRDSQYQRDMYNNADGLGMLDGFNAQQYNSIQQQSYKQLGDQLNDQQTNQANSLLRNVVGLDKDPKAS